MPADVMPRRLPRWAQRALIVAVTAAAAYGMIYVDVLARAREAFRRGAEYGRWHENPELKKRTAEAKYLKERSELEKQREKGKLSEDDFRMHMEILDFDRNRAMEESAVKYAYQWYKDTYELFSPPESRWVRRARYLAPAAKERWRDELRAAKVPFEEYNLDLEPGEESGKEISVYSTTDKREAEQAKELLEARGVAVTLYDAPANGYLEQAGIRVLVPRDSFWEAHDALKAIAQGPLPAETEQ